MNKNDIFKQCVIDVKQNFKQNIFNSKIERVNHPFKSYNKSGKSPYPFDNSIGSFAKNICGNDGFFQIYKSFYQIRKINDFFNRKT